MPDPAKQRATKLSGFVPEEPEPPSGWWGEWRAALSTDPDDVGRLAEPEKALRRRKGARLILGILLAAAIVTALVFVSKLWFIYDARSIAESAASELAAGRPDVAWERALVAARQQPQDRVVLHVLAEVATQAERWDRAAGAWTLLERTGVPLSADDQLRRAVVLVATGDSAAALAALEAARVLRGMDEPRALLIRTRLALRLRDPAAAEMHLKALLTRAEVGDAERLEAVREAVTLPRASAELLGIAMQDLARLARGDGPVALAALEEAVHCLGGLPVEDGGLGEPIPRSELTKLLRARPGFRARLLSLEAELRSDPARRSEIHGALIQEAARDGSREAMELASAWLIERGDFLLLLEHLTPSRARESTALGKARIEVLLAIGRTRDARMEVESQRYPIDEFLEQMLLARINEVGGNAEAAQGRWSRSLKMAGQDRPRLRRLADYARKCGADLTADAAEASLTALDRVGTLAEVPK